MTFDLSDEWVWDFWLADDAGTRHLFFLCAPRSLGDPELRHRNACVGHATSSDLRHWERLPDALAPGPAPAYDDIAIWTGSVVRDDAGTWWMLTSGLSRADGGREQRWGASTSLDLTTWTRVPDAGPVTVDGRWYADATTAPAGEDVHWRDPFVVRDADGLWHAYVTARAVEPPGVSGFGEALVGHATSTDLTRWTVGPPLSAVGPEDPVPFDQCEVIRLREVDGQWVLIFSCLAPEMPGAEPGAGGVWCVHVDGPGSPVDLAAAYRLVGEEWYVGDLVSDPRGGWGLMAFRFADPDGRFVGGVCDPMPVTWESGRLVVR